MRAPITLLALALFLAAGCKSAREHREASDEAAYAIVAEKQEQAFGKAEPFTVERPADTLRRRLLALQDLPHAGPASLGARDLPRPEAWPEDAYPSPDPSPSPVPWEGPEPLALTLADALQIGARNSRDYQAAKEDVFLSALDLEFERDRFDTSWFGVLTGRGQADLAEGGLDGVEGTAELEATRLLKNGALLAGRIGIDIAKLLTGSRASSFGVFGDASITIPLLRGSGRLVVTEPLTQAERNVLYELRDFVRFRRVFAVRVASGYLDVLRRLDEVANAAENYRGLVVLTRRTQAMLTAGRLPGVQVDQARQDELRARDRWISAQLAYEARLDAFKESIGLPPDARIALDTATLADVARVVSAALPRAEGEEPEEGELLPADAEFELEPPSEEGGPLELDPRGAIALALERREDVKVARGRVEDAQRAVIVAADALRAGLDLTGTGFLGERRSLGSAEASDAWPDPDDGLFSLTAILDLPFERTAEALAYRASYLELEAAVRAIQALEDQVKIDVRSALRTLLEAREGLRIQEQAVALARERVQSTNMLLEAGRAEVRDVLEAQEALVSAQNALTAALVRYRVAELELQRDLGVLEVGPDGLWKEYSVDAAP